MLATARIRSADKDGGGAGEEVPIVTEGVDREMRELNLYHLSSLLSQFIKFTC